MSYQSNMRFDVPRRYVRGGGAKGAILDTALQIAEGIITNKIAEHINAKTSKNTQSNNRQVSNTAQPHKRGRSRRRYGSSKFYRVKSKYRRKKYRRFG